MTTIFVRHEVSDYDEWRKGYDGFDDTRKEMGVKAHGVYTHAENPNDVTIYHRFDSVDDAQSFLSDDRLKTAMQNAGVVGEPDIWITEER